MSAVESVTLKLEMEVFPACLRVWLTQPTMVSSVTFCPSPSSSRMFRVYLRKHTGFQNKSFISTLLKDQSTDLLAEAAAHTEI